MKILWVIIPILIAIFAVAYIGLNSNATHPNTPPPTKTTPTPPKILPASPPPPPPSPSTIASYSGSGIKTTNSFTISSSPWAISWSSDPDTLNGSPIGIFQIMVYDASNPSYPLTLAANTQYAGSDTSYIHQTGTFYLTINAANTRWSVEIIGSP